MGFFFNNMYTVQTYILAGSENTNIAHEIYVSFHCKLISTKSMFLTFLPVLLAKYNKASTDEFPVRLG